MIDYFYINVTPKMEASLARNPDKKRILENIKEINKRRFNFPSGQYNLDMAGAMSLGTQGANSLITICERLNAAYSNGNTAIRQRDGQRYNENMATRNKLAQYINQKTNSLGVYIHELKRLYEFLYDVDRRGKNRDYNYFNDWQIVYYAEHYG